MIPYQNRKDLTKEEKEAISHYKDLTNRQYEWDLKVRRKKGMGIDCQIINGVSRGDYSYAKLSWDDKSRYSSTKRLITSAINKSQTDRDLYLFKGIKPFDELKEYTVGANILQPAFGSFTSNLDIAINYAGKDETTKEYILYYLKLNKGSKALYVDSDEDEWIIGANHILHVDKIKHTNVFGKRAIVYHLRVTT